MSQCTVAEQALVEHRTLQHVKDALRITLEWRVNTVGLPRKVSSVRFMALSLERHLTRLMDLEEDGGYMQAVRELKPYLTCRVESLKDEHENFRELLQEIMPTLRGIAETDEQGLSQSGQQLVELLKQVDRHDSCETSLLQEAFLCDDGGEG